MKGIVFTEFMDMVEAKFGYQMVDDLIEESDLPSNGIYTAVGTYDHSEIVALLTLLSQKTKTEPQVLLKAFGVHLFSAFLKAYPQFFNEVDHVFDFLESIDGYIHVEVKKLYADATLPKFEVSRELDQKMTMIYRSDRMMSALAEGLIEESIAHYKQPYSVDVKYLDEQGKVVEFVISKVIHG